MGIGHVTDISPRGGRTNQFRVYHSGLSSYFDVYAVDELGAYNQYLIRKKEDDVTTRIMVLCAAAVILAGFGLIAWRGAASDTFRYTMLEQCMKANRGFLANAGGVACK